MVFEMQKKKNTHKHKCFWKACRIKENEISFLITVFLLDYYFLYIFYFLTLQYCIDFAIYQHESATGVHGQLIQEACSLL